MSNKPESSVIITALALTAAGAIAAYTFFKTYKSVKELEDIRFDFGNDDGLMSMLTPKYDRKD